MAREKMPDLKRKGNWKNAPDDTPKKKETKKAPVGAGAKPKAKPAKPKMGAGAKPKAKPESVKAKGYKRTMDNAGGPRKSTKKSVAKNPPKTSPNNRKITDTRPNDPVSRVARGVRRVVQGKDGGTSSAKASVSRTVNRLKKGARRLMGKDGGAKAATAGKQMSAAKRRQARTGRK